MNKKNINTLIIHCLWRRIIEFIFNHKDILRLHVTSPTTPSSSPLSPISGHTSLRHIPFLHTSTKNLVQCLLLLLNPSVTFPCHSQSRPPYPFFRTSVLTPNPLVEHLKCQYLYKEEIQRYKYLIGNH